MKVLGDFIPREVVKETAKAYLVKAEVNNPRDGWHTKFEWVGKSVCKPSNKQGYVDVPEWVIGNAIWG